ncbi:MAG: membrane protein insertion efficiency factor YidD [Clostridiales bacterium]|nr:membrane protein insertion efficiency factor YidD [Clostridia bacterium]MCR4563298.1 membrane protein insertion efficiency factor YidD [Clostridiales bacterium]
MTQVFIKLIKFYQRHISPHLPARCKFYPTCSSYAVTAFERFGFFKGLMLTLWRLIRCSPLTSGGYDPVPEKKIKR